MAIRIQYNPDLQLAGQVAHKSGADAAKTRALEFERQIGAQLALADIGRAHDAAMFEASAAEAKKGRDQAFLGQAMQMGSQFMAEGAQRANREDTQAHQMEVLDRQFDQAAVARQDQVDAQRERDLLVSELDLKSRKTLAEQEFDARLFGQDIKHEQDIKRIEFEYTQQEAAHNAKVEKAMAWVDEQAATAKWTPEEVAYMKAQLQGITKPPTQKPVTMQDLVQQQTMPVPGFPNKVYVRDNDGGLKIEELSKVYTPGDMARIYSQLTREEEDALGGKRKIPPTREEMQQFIGMLNEFNGGDAGFGLPGRKFVGAKGASAEGAQAQPVPGWTPQDDDFLGKASEQARPILEKLSREMGVPPTRLVNQLPRIQGPDDWAKVPQGGVAVYNGKLLVK